VRDGGHPTCAFLATATVDYSIHPPTWFLNQHLQELLPDWSDPVQSLVVVLQKSAMPLLRKTKLVEQEKSRLRQEFLMFGQSLAKELQVLGYATEVFDPCNGLPTLSRPGETHLDHLALIQALLGHPRQRQGKCWVMEHPQWGKAVYPSVMVSAAQPGQLSQIVDAHCQLAH
jgi:Methylmalonic aciduria and homocystinuria type D protein